MQDGEVCLCQITHGAHTWARLAAWASNVLATTAGGRLVFWRYRFPCSSLTLLIRTTKAFPNEGTITLHICHTWTHAPGCFLDASNFLHLAESYLFSETSHCSTWRTQGTDIALTHGKSPLIEIFTTHTLARDIASPFKESHSYFHSSIHSDNPWISKLKPLNQRQGPAAHMRITYIIWNSWTTCY